MNSVSSTPSASAPATDRIATSFWKEHRGFASVIAVLVIVIIVGALRTGGMFQQPWTLNAGTSQPRFIHVQGAPAWKMFDNKTAQSCSSSPIVYDSLDYIKRDMGFDVRRDQEKKCESWDQICLDRVGKVTDSIITDTLTNPFNQIAYPQYKEFYDRYDALMASPDKPPIYGGKDRMPYCSELAKKWW